MSNYRKGKDINKSKQKMNRLRLAFLIIAVVFIFITIRFYSAILNTKMLPASYVTIITIVEIVLTIALVLGLVKKHKTFKLNIFCLIIIIITSSAYLFANHYVDITMKFLRGIFTEIAEVEEYYVIVRKDSTYSKIEDIKDKNVYVFQIEDDVKEKIQNKVTIKLNPSDDLTTIGTDLLQRKIDIIIISSSQYSILSEEIDGFKENTKIIFTETHKIETQESIEDANSEYNIENGVFNVYISGIDTYGNIRNVARSDANIIATVNLKTHEILLTSIPRDYYITLHSKKAKDKLTHSGIYGINETVKTVEDFMGIDINYYIRVNFTTVIKLVDTLGGVDVYSDYGFTTREGYSFQKGYNHLNGNSALAFSRERNSFASGDNQRIKNQQKVIEAIINKVTKSSTILNKYTDILKALSGSFNTNIDQETVMERIVKVQLDKMPTWKVKTISLEGTPSMGSTYSMGSQPLSIMLVDEKSVQSAKTEIQKVLDNR